MMLMRPSHPTRQRCPRRKHAWRSYTRCADDLGRRRGKMTRRTPCGGRLTMRRGAEAAIAGGEIGRAMGDGLMAVQLR
jgi:hypothetical protein